MEEFQRENVREWVNKAEKKQKGIICAYWGNVAN
jgi:hypothetical protein